MKTLIVKRGNSPIVLKFPVGEMAENIHDILSQAPDHVTSGILNILTDPTKAAYFKEQVSGIIAAHIQEAIQQSREGVDPAYLGQLPEPRFSFVG